MTAVELLPPAEAVHGNDRWYELRRAGVTASEIAIVLGISPYGSPFSLYWQKVNDWRDDGNEFTSAGRHLEDAIADWWMAEQDPLENLVAVRAGLYASSERPWQLATPDRLLGLRQLCGSCDAGLPMSCACGAIDEPIALLECKWVAYSWDGWGDLGTDEVPVYYRAQALWQLDVLGVDEVHFAVLGPGGFRAYRIRRDERDLRILRAAGERFMRQLAAGTAPDIDEHPATAAALKALHPSVEDFDVEVPLEMAEGYRRARALRSRIDAVVEGYETRIRAAIGAGRRAVCNGKLVASRSVYDQSGDSAELTAIETDWPVVDRLNPGRSKTYA